MNGKVLEKRIACPWWVASAIEDETPERTWAVTGGLGSGKSTGAAMVTIDRWLLNRQSQFTWCVAPTATRCEQIIIPALRQVLFDLYGMTEGKQYRIYRGRFFKLVLKNYQHEIHILSGDNPEGFVGANISFYWVTEPGLMDRIVYEKLEARLRCPKAIVRQGLLEGTPEGLSGRGAWWADVGDVAGSGYDRLDAQNNRRRLIVETRMNRWLQPSPDVYVKKLEAVYGHDLPRLRAYTLGQFTAFTKSSAYFEWVASRNLIEPVEADPAVPIIFTWDFNATPLAWVVMQKRWTQRDYFSPRKEQYVALAESDGHARGLMDGVAEFAAKFPVSIYRDTLIQIYGDASGFARSHKVDGSDFAMIEQALRKLGYRRVEVVAAKSNPMIKERLEKTAALMAYEMFVATSDCRRLVSGFTKTALKEGTWQIDKPQGEDHTHWPDACTYALYQIYKSIDVMNPDAKPILGVA